MESDFSMFDFLLGNVLCRLHHDVNLRKVVESFFLDWPEVVKISGDYTDTPKPGGTVESPLVNIALTLSNKPTKESPGNLIYSRDLNDIEAGYQSLKVYRAGEEIIHTFPTWGSVRFTSNYSNKGYCTEIAIALTSSEIPIGIFEDIFYAGLAPVFRRLAYFMIHGFAAARDGKAILLIGESGSGKTTTGLKLCQVGWGYLANDVVLLQSHEDGIYAYPMPGTIGVAEGNGQVKIPESEELTADGPRTQMFKQYLPASSVTGGWASETRVSAIILPQITSGVKTSLDEIEQPLLLAKLMENSIDSWDVDNLPAHMDFLRELAAQAQGYNLVLAEGANDGHKPLDLLRLD